MMSTSSRNPGKSPARLAISSTGAAISATGVRISLATSVKRLTLASSRSSLFLRVIEAICSRCARPILRRSHRPPARHGQQSQHAVGHDHGACHPPRRQHEDLDHGLLAELLAAGRGAHDEAVTVRRQVGVGDMLHPGPFVQAGGDPFVVEVLQPVTVDRP